MMNAHKNAFDPSDVRIIQPGSTIGMVGGGQLGRMFAMAAAEMGYRVVILCEDRQSPAAQVAYKSIVGSLDDDVAVDQFAQQCDVITLEFENIPADTIARCGEVAPTYPASSVLATAQDRLLEKSTLRQSGLPVTPFGKTHDRQTTLQLAEQLGWPLIIKTARSGYDGKGQYRLDSPADLDTVDWGLTKHWIAEQCISFDREVSVIVARTSDGRTKCFPLFENIHSRHILDITLSPASVSPEIADQAEQIATSAAQTLGVVGLLCVEMFVVNDGSEPRILINELAPRPHNSGHLTIEACRTSQFEQHVRAVCGLPLGQTDLVVGGSAMANLLGDLWLCHEDSPPWDKALAVEGIRLHLYGKQQAEPGRKMGHLTATAATIDEARRRVSEARDALLQTTPDAVRDPEMRRTRDRTIK